MVANKQTFDWRKHGVSASALADWLHCRQYSKLKKQGWVPKQTALPLRYGILAHEVLEQVHGAQRNGKAFDAEKIVLEVCAKIEKEESGLWTDDETETFEHMRVQLRAVIPAYVKYYEKTRVKITDIEGWFDFPFEGTRLIGRFDLVFDRKGHWLLDSKNKAQINDEEMGDVLIRDFQVNLYVYALWKKTGKFPKGFIYNVLRRPALQLGKTESMTGHLNRIREHIKEKGPKYYFQRYEVVLVKDDILHFECELKEIVKEFGAWCDAGMPTRLFGQPCVGRWGVCPMVPICYNDDYSKFRKIDFSKKGKRP